MAAVSDNNKMQSDPPDSNDGRLVVPDGFAVRYWRTQPAPGVYATSGGLCVVSLGYIGDDFDRLEQMVERVQQSNASCTATVAASSESVADCFESWDTLDTYAVDGGIVWTAYADGLSWMLGDSTLRDRLLAALRVFQARRQWLVLEAAPPLDLRAYLDDMGVSLVFSSPQHHFLVEIEGPDKRTLSGISHGSPMAAVQYEHGALSSRPMLSAVHLIRQLDTLGPQGALRPLFDALLAHPGALIVRSDAAGQIAAMSFAHSELPFVPVYPDMSTAMRAHKEIDGEAAPFAVAPFEPRKFFEWARELDGGVAVGYYALSDSSIRYVAIEKTDLAILCDGSLRRRYSFVDQVRMFCGLRPRATGT